MEVNTQVLSSALCGVIGAFITMMGKYFVDQLMERHKVELNLAAMRRGRCYEKQMNAVEDAYEMLPNRT